MFGEMWNTPYRTFNELPDPALKTAIEKIKETSIEIAEKKFKRYKEKLKHFKSLDQLFIAT